MGTDYMHLENAHTGEADVVLRTADMEGFHTNHNVSVDKTKVVAFATDEATAPSHGPRGR